MNILSTQIVVTKYHFHRKQWKLLWEMANFLYEAVKETVPYDTGTLNSVLK